MGWNRFSFMPQPMMRRVIVALLPCVAASVWLFGWRSLLVVVISICCACLVEALFNASANRPLTQAAIVTGLIFALSLPPGIPLWMVALGSAFGITFGKMAFGGFGFNAFNPAMVGRCFLYITFPQQLTQQWHQPGAGILHWSTPPIDAATTATPLVRLATGGSSDPIDLLLGFTSGSLGETSALLIVIGGTWMLASGYMPWRLCLACLAGGLCAGGVLSAWHPMGSLAVLHWMLAGSFLFGAFFVVTEPVSAPRNKTAQLLYGALVGALTMVLRRWSNFPEGVMFAVLCMNMFAAIMDVTANALNTRVRGS